MPRNPHSPLDDSHLAQIRAAEPAIEKARAQILMAKQAGINVDQQETKLEDAADKLKKIKSVYFPGE
ncbi:MAG: hypothetical protein RB191_24975 [Terriglobia bacterium]|nr:hypothetical protein [Terriglobia bacterium]